MIVANVLAKLEADSTNLVRNVGRSVDALDKLEKSAGKAGRAVDSSMDKSGKSVGGMVQKAKQAETAAQKFGDASTKSFDRSAAAAGRLRDSTGRFVAAANGGGGSGSGGGGGLPGVVKNLDKIEASSKKAGGGLNGFVGQALKLGAAIGVMRFFSEAIAGVSQAVLGYNQDLEQAMIGMETMLGSASKAQKFMAEIQEFAAKTPFSFRGLVSATQSMMALGFESKDVLPNLRAVGDATAALGGSMEDMGARVIRALGQMKAKGKVSAEEMMQLAEAGIPAWQYLADAIGVDVPEAMNIARKKGIESSIAIKAVMKGMDSDFGGMMEKQSQTMMGSWSTVLDYLQMNVAQATKPLFDTVKGGIISIAKWMESPAATKFADKFTDAITKSFSAISKLVGPPVEHAVELFKNMFEIAQKVGPRLQGVWITLGAAIVVAVKALDGFIRLFSGIVSFASKNEVALKLVTTAVIALVSAMAAQKVIGFFNVFTTGAGNALSSVKNFGTYNSAALKSVGGDIDKAKAAMMGFTNFGGATNLAKSIDGVGASATKAKWSFKTAGKNLLDAFGGPTGIAVAASIAFIGWRLQQAAKKAAEFDAKVQDMEGRLRSATKDTPGLVGHKKLTQQVKTEVVVDYLYEGAGKGLAKDLREVKINAADVQPWLEKNAKGIQALDKAMDAQQATGKGSARAASQFTNALRALGKAQGDYSKALDIVGSGTSGAVALEKFNDQLEKAGTNTRAFVNSGFGKAMIRIATVTKGLDDKQINKLVDGLSDAQKAYDEGTLSAREYDRIQGKILKDAAEAKKKMKPYTDGLLEIDNTIEAGSKVLTKNLQDFDDYVSGIATTWNNVDLSSLEDLMGLDEFEKSMDDRLVYIAKWTSNLKFLMENGLDASVLDQFMTGGPQQFAKIVADLAKSPEKIAGLNKRFADEANLDGMVGKMKTDSDLMAQLVAPGSTLMSVMEWAATHGVDLFKQLAAAPEIVKKQWKESLTKIAFGMSAFIDGFKGREIKIPAGVDMSKLKTGMKSHLDAFMASNPDLAVQIGVDPKGAVRTIDTLVGKIIASKPGAEIEINGKVQDKKLVAGVRNMIDYIDRTMPSLKIKADPKKAKEMVGALIAMISNDPATLSILADPAEGMKAYEELAAEIDETTGTLTIDGKTIPADSKLYYLKNRIDNETGTIIIDADEKLAIEAIGRVQAAIARLLATGFTDGKIRSMAEVLNAPAPKEPAKNRTHQIPARWGAIHSFAQGGIEAHVQNGQRIKYAEPSTGGEAYIPRLGNKLRSEAIMSTIAEKWFGGSYVPKNTLAMANGGITTMPASEALLARLGKWKYSNGEWRDKTGNLVGTSPIEDGPITWEPQFAAALTSFFAGKGAVKLQQSAPKLPSVPTGSTIYSRKSMASTHDDDAGGIHIRVEAGAIDARNTNVDSITTQLSERIGWKVSNASRRN